MTVGESGFCPSVILEVLREMLTPQHEEYVHVSVYVCLCVFMLKRMDTLREQQSKSFSFLQLSAALDILLLQRSY